MQLSCQMGIGMQHVPCCLLLNGRIIFGTRTLPGPQLIEQFGNQFAGYDALLRRARKEGTLARGTKLRESARFLTTTFQALNVAALAGRDRHELRALARKALADLHRT